MAGRELLRRPLVRADSAFDAPLHDGVMVLNAASGRFHALDAVGVAVWEELAQPSTLSDLVQRLCARFAVSPEECQRDVTAFLEALLARGLVAQLDHPVPSSTWLPVA